MTTMTLEQVPVLDFQGIASLEDPYPMLAGYRRESPLVKGTIPLVWGVTRHAEVSALIRDERLLHQFPRNYVTFQFGEGPAVDFVQNILLNRDPPDHTRLRTLMGKAFRGLTVRKLHDHIVDLVDGYLEPALDGGSFDMVSDFAYQVPVQVICELLDLPNVDRNEVRDNAAALIGVDFPAVHRATAWLRDYVGGMLADRRPDPEGDLLQRMLAAEDGDDGLTHEEIVDNAVLLFFAGFETTTNLIANGTAALLQHPDEAQRLVNDPTLAPSAVEEFLRYDAPLMLVQRITGEEMEIGGRRIPPMNVVLLMLASANHDEDVFERPEELDISRKPNPHVSFGGGIHHCLGAMLARLEGGIAFQRLAERITSIEPDGEAVRRQSAIRSFSTLPVKVTAA